MEKQTNQIPTDEISLKDIIKRIKALFGYLLSKWLPILIFSILGGVLGIYYATTKKIIYTANTSFVLEEDKMATGLGSISGLASMAGVDLDGGGGGIFQGDNIIELYKSRNMIEKTLLTEVNINGKKQLLIDSYIDFNKLRKDWAKDPLLKNITFQVSQENVNPSSTKVGRLRDSILREVVKDINKNYLNAAKPDKKLSIINVTISASNEEFAKAFNEEIVKNVNDFYLQTKTKKSLNNVLILQKKTDSVRDVMNGAIYSAARVADATPNLNPTRMTQRAAPMQKSQFSAETNKAMLSQLITNLEMSKIALVKETPLLQIVDTPILPLEKKGFGKFKGLVFGGLLFGFLITAFFSLKLIFKNILKDE